MQLGNTTKIDLIYKYYSFISFLVLVR